MMKTISSTQQQRAQERMLFGVAGTLWMLGWCLQKPGRDLSTLLLILLSGTAIFLWAWCDFQAAQADRSRRTKAVRPASLPPAGALQGGGLDGALLLCGLLFNLILLLQLLGHADWMVSGLMLLTGLCCLPLGKIQRYRLHYLTGGALIVAALVYAWPGMDGHAALPGCFAAGGIFWVSALHGFVRDHSRASQPAALARSDLVLALH